MRYVTVAPTAAVAGPDLWTPISAAVQVFKVLPLPSTIRSPSGPAGRITEWTAAVFVAERFDGKGADRKPAPRTPKELEDLKNVVKSALGIEDTGDPTRKDELTLEEMPFNDQIATELTQQLDQQGKRQMWIDLASKMVYPALAVGMILMFLRLLKNTKADDIPIGIPLGDGHGNGNGNGHFGRTGGVVTVDVLNQLIHENPANMTQAVRTWMTRTKPNN